LTLEVEESAVEVNSEPCLPIRQAPDPGRVGEHGLEMVMAACRSFEMHRAPVGKRTVAAVMLADDPVLRGLTVRTLPLLPFELTRRLTSHLLDTPLSRGSWRYSLVSAFTAVAVCIAVLFRLALALAPPPRPSV